MRPRSLVGFGGFRGEARETVVVADVVAGEAFGKVRRKRHELIGQHSWLGAPLPCRSAGTTRTSIRIAFTIVARISNLQFDSLIANLFQVLVETRHF